MHNWHYGTQWQWQEEKAWCTKGRLIKPKGQETQQDSTRELARTACFVAPMGGFFSAMNAQQILTLSRLQLLTSSRYYSLILWPKEPFFITKRELDIGGYGRKLEVVALPIPAGVPPPIGNIPHPS